MRGIVDMHMTHEEMCNAVELWLRNELRESKREDFRKPNEVPTVGRVSQSKRNHNFLIEFGDKP